MGNAWDTAKERAENAGSGIFVRLADDGDKVVGVFCGDPLVREVVYNKKLEQFEDYTEEHRTKGIAPGTPKYTMNFYVIADKAMKVLEVNNTTFLGVIAAREKYGFDKWAFEVKRSGKKGSQKTTYSVLPEQAKAEDLAAAKACELHDLAKLREGDAATDLSSHDKAKTNGTAAVLLASTNGSTTNGGGELIDPIMATELVGRIKVLPREKIDAWLAKFKIQQVKALKKSDLESARAYLTELEPPKAAAAPAGNVDPFAV